MRRIAYFSMLPLGALTAVLAACSDGPEPTAIAKSPSPVVAGPPGEITVTDLAALGVTGNPVDINNLGQVVGGCMDRDYFPTSLKPDVLPAQPDPQRHAFLWSAAGGVRDLGTLGRENSCASAINEAGTVVGYSETSAGRLRAFVWTAAGGMKDLGVLPGGTQSRALDVNTAGHIVGWSNAPDGCKHAVLWTPDGIIHDLGTLPPLTYRQPGGAVIPFVEPRSYRAMAINDVGQVVGDAEGLVGPDNVGPVAFL